MDWKPGFPRNWRVEESNGRRWLVRPFCEVVGQTYANALPIKMALEVEQGVRLLNYKQWKINDPIVVAIDPTRHQPFILDLSNASQVEPQARKNFAANDMSYLLKWFRAIGLVELAELRESGQSILKKTVWMSQFQEFRHGYRFNDKTTDLPGFGVNWEYHQQSWLLTSFALPAEVATKHNLTWAWSPLEHEPMNVPTPRPA